MKKYNIHINRKPISSEEIAKGKDFQAVLKGAKLVSKPVYKKTWFKANVFVVIVAVTAIFIFEDPKKENSTTTKSFISPLFNNIDVANNSYKINSDSLQEIVYKTGSKITILAHSFVDKNGKPIHGIVEINYREMHNVKDIVLSGIPMNYDSAGNSFTLESAGMLEIKGSQNGKEIYIDGKKSLKIDMVSKQNGSDYNLYKLDTIKKNWINKGKDSTSNLPNKPKKANNTTNPINSEKSGKSALSKKLELEIAAIQKEMLELRKEKPIKPQPIEGPGIKLLIGIDIKQFPEYAIYKNALWTVDENKTPFNPEHGLVSKKNIEVIKKATDNSCVIKIKLDKQVVEYAGKSGFEEYDYYQAMKVYNKLFGAYAQKVKEKQRLIDAKKDSIEQQKPKIVSQKKYVSTQIKYIDPLTVEQRIQMVEDNLKNNYYYENSSTNETIMRSFSVNSFGVWNCDRPLVVENFMKYTISFVNKMKEKLNIKSVSIVNKKLNTIFTFSRAFENDFNIKFDTASENMIIAVTEDNKLAYLNYEEFKKTFITSKPYKPVELKVFSKEITSVKEFEELYDGNFEDSIVQEKINNPVEKIELSVIASPNPCYNKLNITMNDDSEYKVELYSYTGSNVKYKEFNGKEFTIDMTDITSGMYVLRVTRIDDNSIVTSKIIKK